MIFRPISRSFYCVIPGQALLAGGQAAYAKLPQGGAGNFDQAVNAWKGSRATEDPMLKVGSGLPWRVPRKIRNSLCFLIFLSPTTTLLIAPLLS